MKSVRLFFKKGGSLRFISHLDLNRFMLRAVRRAGLPIWYTEGFNPHPYLTFALPLSLGHFGEYEIMDIRLTDDDFDITTIPEILNGVCPEDIRFYRAAEPVLKTGEITFASYEVCFDDNGELKNPLESFLKQAVITVKKRTKKGDFKSLDIKPKMKDTVVTKDGENTVLKAVFPAGGVENLNPELLLSAFFENNEAGYFCYTVTRKSILDKNGEPFR